MHATQKTDLLIGCAAIGHAFNRSEGTVQRWIRNGVIPHRRLPDGTAITSLSAISAWIIEGEPAE